MRGLRDFFDKLLNSPLKVAIICLCLSTLSLGVDGSISKWLGFQGQIKKINSHLKVLDDQTRDIDFRIQQSQNLDFIEQQARDRMNLVEEDELVFVFSGEEI